MMKSKSGLISITVFISGVCALIYQVVWLRYIFNITGVHIYSTSSVLTAFMAGLAIGSYLFGNLADRRIKSIHLYFLIQAGLFLYAVSFQYLFSLFKDFFFQIQVNHDPGSTSQLYLNFIQAFLLLIIPTTLIGGVIPVVSKIVVKDIGKLGSDISWIYFLFNVGSAIGGLAAGFLLIRLLGMKETLLLAGVLNLLNLGIIVLTRYTGTRVVESPVGREESSNNYSRKYIRLVLIVFGLEGFTTLAYEIIWTRLFVEFSYDKTVFMYSVIVAGFVFGLGLGGLFIRRRINRVYDPAWLLGFTQVSIGLVSFALLMLFVFLTPYLVAAREQVSGWLMISGREYLLMFIVLTLPVILMGFTFPLVAKIVSGNLPALGRRIGLVGFLDTAGSIAGAFVAGFIMIPLLGIYFSFMSTVFLNLMLGMLLFIFHSKKDRIRYALITLFAGALILVFAPSGSDYFKQRVRYYPGEEVVSYTEGVAATVSVHRLASGHSALAINGSKTAFSTSSDLKVHRMLAYTPYLLSADSGHSFVIGFGMGVTANCLADLKVGEVDIAEISPAVAMTSQKQFAWLNDNVLEKDNVNLYYEDGRSRLLKSQRKYSLITSNAVHARLGANLYTTEFYRICREKLTETGYMCQWLPTNWLNDKEFKSLIRSFIEVFPNSTLWYVTRGHLLLLGSISNEESDFDLIKSRFSKTMVIDGMRESEIRNPSHFLGHLLALQVDLKKFTKGIQANTDNLPIVEYSLETNLSPNYNVLKEVLDIRPSDSYINSAISGVKTEDTKKIKQYNHNLREELISFLSDYRSVP